MSAFLNIPSLQQNRGKEKTKKKYLFLSALQLDLIYYFDGVFHYNTLRNAL
jgi:hypothetical protein